MSSLNALNDTYKEKAADYIDQLYPIVLKVLQTDPYTYSTDPTSEAEPDYDANQNNLITQVLVHLIDFLSYHPQLYYVHYEELFDELRELRTSDVNQKVLRH